MAIYAVGDVQGCFDALMRLVSAIGFDPAADQLWLAGDLVNRGPDSLSTLRWARDQGDAVVAVLGNHDLHLLAAAAGLRGPGGLAPILDAPDRDQLLEWVLHRPVMHRAGRWIMVHAGLLPQWSWAEAERRARRAEVWLRSVGFAGGALEDTTESTLEDDVSPDTPAHDLRVMTHIRTCTPEGRLGSHKGPPEQTPAGYAPWYAHPTTRDDTLGVVFGHWAAHGLWVSGGHVTLDTGCVWGGSLTAVRLEDLAVTQVKCDHGGF
ncbi:MAG: symmetrical bis(5'-nucleosyl)-tetraphosphatase [Bradymonadia bacterium]